MTRKKRNVFYAIWRDVWSWKRSTGISRTILEGLDEILTVTPPRRPFGIAPIIGFHEHHRVDECCDPSGLSKCEALA